MQVEFGFIWYQDDVVDIEYLGLVVVKYFEVVWIGYNDVGNCLVVDWGGVFLVFVVGDVGVGVVGMFFFGQFE